MKPIISLLLGYTVGIMHICFDVMSSGCVQVLQGSIPDFQLTAIRLFLQVIVLSFVSKLKGQLHMLDITDLKWMGVAIFGYTSHNFGYYGAAKCMPLPDHGSLTYVVAMVTIAVLHQIFKLESPGKVNLLAMCVCGLGILMTTQPSYLFPKHTVNGNNSFIQNTTSIRRNITECYNDVSCESSRLTTNFHCYFLLFLGGTGVAILIFALDHGLSHISPLIQTFWTSFGGFWISMPMTFYTESINIDFVSHKKEMFLLFGHCLGAGLAAYLGNVGIKLIGGVRYTLLISLSVVVQLVVANRILESYQPGRGNVLEVIGVLTVMLGMMLPGILEIIQCRYNQPQNTILEDLKCSTGEKH